jgi:hypothetical protein
MKHIFVILCSMVFLSASLKAQNSGHGAVSYAMGGVFVTNTDFWSSVNNQAGLAWIEQPTLGIGYNNEFMISELATKYAGFAMPLKGMGAFGLNVSQFGFKLLNQTKVGVGYGMKFTENFSGGIQLDYFHLKLGDIYGSTGTFTFEAGVMYNLNNQWRLGAHLFNPLMAKLADFNDERMTTMLSAGVSFLASEQVQFAAEIEKAIENKPSMKIGIDYSILDFLKVRIGAASNPTRLSFGFGLVFDQFLLDFAGSYHERLGFSPSTGIVYQFNKPGQ